MPPVLEELPIIDANAVLSAVSATVNMVKEKMGLADRCSELHPGMLALHAVMSQLDFVNSVHQQQFCPL